MYCVLSFGPKRFLTEKMTITRSHLLHNLESFQEVVDVLENSTGPCRMDWGRVSGQEWPAVPHVSPNVRLCTAILNARGISRFPRLGQDASDCQQPLQIALCVDEFSVKVFTKRFSQQNQMSSWFGWMRSIYMAREEVSDGKLWRWWLCDGYVNSKKRKKGECVILQQFNSHRDCGWMSDCNNKHLLFSVILHFTLYTMKNKCNKQGKQLGVES